MMRVPVARIALICVIVTVAVEVAAQQTAPPQPSATPVWQYGAFIDFGYLKDFNDPANHLFRDRGTTFWLNGWVVNMAGAYLKKAATAESRWGTELTFQTGKDSEQFGFSATAPNLAGSKWLRHLGPTDLSYLAPVGKGLTIQGGIFGSLIGYDSLYAKDNLNYTRPWGADYTPYLMLGVNASYPFSDRTTGTMFVVNDYFHLANPNSVPSFGGQIAYKATGRVTLKETVLVGPHQEDTAFEFWRLFSDTIVEWKSEKSTVAFEYQVGQEKVATASGERALWMAAQLPLHYAFDKHWSATVRPETAWDRNGRWTGSAQTIKAVTSTLEFQMPYRSANAIVRLEHRWDDSRGPGGGFYQDGVAGGTPRLTPTQHLLSVGVILTLDRASH
jgi:hypothetical protein